MKKIVYMIFIVSAILMSCNREIYINKVENITRSIEFKKDYFKYKLITESQNYRTRGNYSIADNKIELHFNFVKDEELILLPNYKSGFEIEYSENKDNFYNCKIHVEDITTKENIIGATVYTYSDNKQDGSITDTYGNVYFQSTFPFQRVKIQYPGLLPIEIQLDQKKDTKINLRIGLMAENYYSICGHSSIPIISMIPKIVDGKITSFYLPGNDEIVFQKKAD